MAFGRSNSLSLNTGATNSLFNQQNNSNPSQPSSLFGASTSQPQQAGGLFGGANAPKAAPTGGLFGTPASQPQQGGGLFGGSQPQPSGGLFGGASNTNQPPASGGGLFGANTSNASGGGGLFGNAQQTQPPQSGSLFGGALGQNQNQNQNQNQSQQSGGGLFGGMGQNQNANQNQGQQQGGGLFGGLGQNQSQPQQGGGGLFGGLGNQNKPATSSLFGGSTTQTQPQNQQPSLFGTSLFNNSTSGTAPLAGSLTMGQSQAQQTVPGTRIDLSNIRPTTRFNDLHDDIKKQIEQIDSFIKQQESFAAQCEALLPAHSTNVASLTPDVELITSKAETVELSLENDSRAIAAAKELAKSDSHDLLRCIRVIENLQLPSHFHYGPSVGGTGAGRSRVTDEEYDVDLIGYFSRQAESMQKTLDTFTSNLGEIESHLRVIEATTMQQSQQVVAQRAGGGAAGNDTIRELADTLRGFEDGILDAAGFVGACREGVNELILGRVGGDSRGRDGYGRY